jgi:hypothetical protein
MTLGKRQIVLCASALALAACGGDAATPPGSSTTPEQAGPQTGTSVQTTPPTAAPGNQTAAGMTPTSSGQAPMMQPNAPANGAAGGAAMQPPKQEPSMPIGMDMPGAKPGDSCTERRVSYSKPCSPDPDPCKINSGWPGDEYCLKPPAEGEGIQIHIGPHDYKNMADVNKYVIKAGEEFNNSVIGNIPLTEDKLFNRITVQMRPGSHHWISQVVDGKPAEVFHDDTSCGGATSVGSLGGGQNLIYDNPPGGKPAPENEGLGRTVAGNTSLCMNLHAYNFSEKPQLREMWINIYFVDESKVTQRASGIGFVGGLGLALPPGQNKEQTYSVTIDKPGRIIQLFGHRHVWTPRFAVWLNDKLIYESWSWQESVTYNYDTLTMNPPINTEAKVDGAVSGPVEVKAGDKIKFSCFVENKSDTTLRFSNELYGGEMCNLWGSAVGTSISGQGF